MPRTDLALFLLTRKGEHAEVRTRVAIRGMEGALCPPQSPLVVAVVAYGVLRRIGRLLLPCRSRKG